ncbi:hypothetical protein ABZ128_02675 [Streptomyces sp. NPDC006326]|uniref:anti-sigma factor family protein n=1 Tax=Streptomyces sp. NPDC006326 TaxID=3156752 RepID=UPI0033A5E2CF
MTPTTGTIRHPEVSEISDLTEGLLSPVRTAEVRRHLAECDLCADVLASLEEIRSLLGTLPGPPRMPADVSGRIDAALAAEALLDSTTPGSAPGDAPRAPRDVSRETSAATAGPATPRPAGHPVGATGPGRRRARRRIAVLTGLAGAAVCALGIFLAGNLLGPNEPDTAARNSATSSSAEAPVDGGYTAQGLKESVHRLLLPGQTAKTAPDENNTYGTDSTSPGPGLAPGDRAAAEPVPSCVQDATGRPDHPLASEQGNYQGTAVYLLVLPHPGDSARVDAYLVDAGCRDAAAAAPGKLLLTRTYPRS